MNEDPSVPPDDPPPDFAWPYHVADFLFEWLAAQWEGLTRLGTLLLKRRLPRLAAHAFLWICVAYIGLVFACLCYIYFPVNPYGLWDIVLWVAIIVAVALGALYTVYTGGTLIASMVLLLLSIAVCFVLSLSFLCWALWGAVARRSNWLGRYRSVLTTGLLASVALATFTDGSYRFWDRPFDAGDWTRLAVISAGAWAALFCLIVRDRAMEPAIPGIVLKWTVGLTMGLGLLAFWGAGSQRAEYFLRKNVVEHPRDVRAWLDLAWHYQDEGDSLAADSGDEDHPAQDPGPSYREALDCLNQAVSLGAVGFDVHFARAQLADEIGDRERAVSFGVNTG